MDFGKVMEINPNLTPEHQAKRRLVYGSTAAPAIMGLNPYRGKRAVYDFMTTGKEVEANNRMIIGSLQESSTLAIHGALWKRKIWTPGMRMLEGSDIIATSVDALSGELDADEPDRCVEAKNVHFGSRDEWGENGTSIAPLHYVAQCQWHCGVWGMDQCDLVAMIGGEISVHPVKASPQLFGKMVEYVERFHRDYVLAGVRPELDGTRASSDEQRTHEWKVDDFITGDAHAEELMMGLLSVSEEIKALEYKEEAYRNLLKDQIKDHSGMRCAMGTITWKPRRGSSSVDWRNLAESFNPTAEQYTQYTKTTQPSRPFVARKAKS